MIHQAATNIFERDLNKLKEEINAYKDETTLWVVKPGISNSAGNLCLHLLGNLNHFIGATLGGTGYVRQRDLEFSSKNIPRAQIVADIEKTIEVVKTSLAKVSTEDLQKEFPFEIGGKKWPTGFMLVYFVDHFSYHLGQINYHRRLIEGA